MSRFIDYLLLGLTSILNYRMRSVLTTLGVVFGIAALLSMMGVGEGARRQLLKEMDSMGLRNIIVSSRRPDFDPQKAQTQRSRSVFSFGLKYRDLKRCEHTIPGLIRALPVMEILQPVVLGGRLTSARVLAVPADYFKAFPALVEKGRNICDLDETRRLPVAVIASPLPPRAFVGREAVNSAVTIGQHNYRLVGIVTPTGESLPSGADEKEKSAASATSITRVFIPYQTALARYGSRRFRYEQGKYERFILELDQIVLECKDPLAALPPLMALLKRGHEKVEFEVTVPVKMLHQRQRTQDIFNVVMLLVAGLTLLVGGIGIINIMLVSVAERTKEIGIRRALGARRWDIMHQFLVETIVLTMTGGLIGIGVGVAGVYGIAAYTGWPVYITPWAVVGSLLVSVAAGVFFGLYPAGRAASVRPSVALRYE
jgi:putative ABC transport system permease protein